MITSKQYQEISIRGVEATQIVRGIDRGGYVLSWVFYYPCSTNVGILSAKAENFITQFGDSPGELAVFNNSRNREG